MADAVVMVRPEGEPARPQRVWGLLAESDTHGPASATFVTASRLPKFVEVEILVAGLVVLDGWVETCEGLGDGSGLYAVTVWGWQRHLDDDLFVKTWMVSGFERALDARDGPGVQQTYWARSGPRLADRSLGLGIQPNTLWYARQAGGVTFDLGPGGAGPRAVWLHQASNDFTSKTSMWLQVHAHSARGNHYPVTAGQYAASTALQLGGLSGQRWHSFTLPATTFRFVTVFLYADGTYDLAKDSPEYFIAFDDIRISLLASGGSYMFADEAVPTIMDAAPKLTLGANPRSSAIYGLRTEGYQSSRQMLERINLDQWRYRVNPGRVLDRGSFPTVPALGVSREASSRLVSPEKFSRVVVLYTDLVGDQRELVKSVSSPRARTQAISLGGNAITAQAQKVADAFMEDQADRRIEGQVVVTPGMLVERPSGQPLHPSRLLLTGGDRLWLDEAEDHGRIVRVSYTHDSETAQVDLTEPTDDLDRTLAHLSNRPT